YRPPRRPARLRGTGPMGLGGGRPHAPARRAHPAPARQVSPAAAAARLALPRRCAVPGHRRGGPAHPARPPPRPGPPPPPPRAPDRRLELPLRLAHAPDTEAAELWVLHDQPLDQLAALARDLDDETLARLGIALVMKGNAPAAVLRLLPSRLPPPVLVFPGAE